MINNIKTDILSQVSSYSNQKNKQFIRKIESEIDEQQVIFNLLNSNNYNEDINNVKKFMLDNKNDINSQLNIINDLFIKLKKLINENNKLKKEKLNLNELLNSPEFNNIAINLRKIKSLKSNIKEFLISEGIWEENMDI